MNLPVSATILCVLVAALLSEATCVRPADWLLRRQRRVSDQRMAELETLMALEKLKGYVVPVGFGKLNPATIGRKRRSVQENNFSLLQRLLLPIAQDAESIQDLSDQVHSLPWKEDPREEQKDYQLI